MTTLTEGVHTGEFLLSEGNGSISREVVTIPSGQGKLPPGTLLNASNEAVDHEDAADAVKILYSAVDATSAAVKAVAIARDAEVFGEKLNFTDYSGDEKLLAAQALAAAGIIVRWQNAPVASGLAAKLAIVSHPPYGVEGEPAGDVVVQVQTLLGVLVNADNTTSVTLSKKSGPGNLTGGGAKTAVDGVVTWTGIEFDSDGEYVLQVTATGLTGAETGTIVVYPAEPGGGGD